jgi:hypothetical protein
MGSFLFLAIRVTLQRFAGVPSTEAREATVRASAATVRAASRV